MADESRDAPPTESDHDPRQSTQTPASPPRTRKVRFEQVRSIGILLTLASLLVLVLYNTFAEGNPWSSRAADVRLLMTVLSVLLGVDVIMGNRAAMVELLAESIQVAGEALITYLNSNTADSDDDADDENEGGSGGG